MYEIVRVRHVFCCGMSLYIVCLWECVCTESGGDVGMYANKSLENRLAYRKVGVG